ncbi:hypothetical protein [Methanoregula sp.]|jgi:hypothetical protein|uniref:hypothetical protein n=1 Tax=Methanoregula sp. TaxID=2052170 RepID=UPI00356756C7
MKEPEVEEPMTKTKSIGLFALTVIFGLTCLGSITWINQIVNHEFFWSGIDGVFVEFGFIIAYVLGIILMGFIASMIFRKYTNSRKDLLVISACSGCVTGIFWFFGMQFLNVVYEYQLGHYITSTTVLDIIPLTITHFFWSGPLMCLIILAIMGLGITGSLIFSYCDRTPEGTLPGTKNTGRTPVQVRTVIIAFIAAILMSIILPLGGDIAAISSGTNSCSQCGPWNPVSMTVTRTDNSTITLQLSMDYDGHAGNRLIPLQSQPLQILVDDRDFSNQSLIQDQDLSDTINPHEGITTYVDGSSVTLSGPDLIRSSSSGTHIYVVSYYNQQNPWVVVDTHV